MSEEYEQYRTPGEVTAKSCPICRGQMGAYTDVNDDPVWVCKNEGCSFDLENLWTFYRHPRPIVLPLELSSTPGLVLSGKVRTYLRYYCPMCDNPMEVIDHVYGIYNCPNCLKMVRCANIREYSGDGKENKDGREYGACYDPNPSKVFEDYADDESYRDEDDEDH